MASRPAGSGRDSPLDGLRLRKLFCRAIAGGSSPPPERVGSALPLLQWQGEALALLLPKSVYGFDTSRKLLRGKRLVVVLLEGRDKLTGQRLSLFRESLGSCSRSVAVRLADE